MVKTSNWCKASAPNTKSRSSTTASAGSTPTESSSGRCNGAKTSPVNAPKSACEASRKPKSESSSGAKTAPSGTRSSTIRKCQSSRSARVWTANVAITSEYRPWDEMTGQAGVQADQRVPFEDLDAERSSSNPEHARHPGASPDSAEQPVRHALRYLDRRVPAGQQRRHPSDGDASADPHAARTADGGESVKIRKKPRLRGRGLFGAVDDSREDP